MNKHLKKILRKMCSIVKADFKKIQFDKEGWYEDFTWTQEQEDKFVDWLADQLYKDKEMFRSLVFYKQRPTKKICKKAAMIFTFQYGWKTK